MAEIRKPEAYYRVYKNKVSRCDTLFLLNLSKIGIYVVQLHIEKDICFSYDRSFYFFKIIISYFHVSIVTA